MPKNVNNKNINVTTKKKNSTTQKKKPTKQVNKKVNNKTTKKSVSIKKIVPLKKEKRTISKHKIFITLMVIVALGILVIVSTYAWLSTSLNVKVKNFNMVVSKNSGLSISFDGINYDSFVEISKNTLIDNLKKTYPNNKSQWADLGLTPVSTLGILNSNREYYDIYATGGVRYKNKKKDIGYISTSLMKEIEPATYNYFIAFDLFLRNDSGSPYNDNLYLDKGTSVIAQKEATEEMTGLINSVRIGFLKIGSVPLNADVNTIQNVKCNNNCSSVIYEPNSRSHTELSIERAKKYNVNLKNNEPFTTHACIGEVSGMEVRNTVSGSPNLNTTYFKPQTTITEANFGKPIFEIPNGITKIRVYLWIEGQDIDSLETDSDGTDIDVSIDLTKDTAGYN